MTTVTPTRKMASDPNVDLKRKGVTTPNERPIKSAKQGKTCTNCEEFLSAVAKEDLNLFCDICDGTRLYSYFLPDRAHLFKVTWNESEETTRCNVCNEHHCFSSHEEAHTCDCEYCESFNKIVDCDGDCELTQTDGTNALSKLQIVSPPLLHKSPHLCAETPFLAINAPAVPARVPP